ncbi:hypothetical protein CLI86_00635 [Tannerella forsythia]|uniref:Uncharacterized protein n=1 Tax=Tannerella forsythia TaxID=28112 RepID=A0A2A6EBV6_TANFO|nr:hypothetical protein CLI86_00635 [Tannerella forsythia]
MVNCQLLIVMPVIRTQRDIPPAPPSKGGRAKAKGGEGEAKRWEKSEHKVRPYAAFRPVA